MDIDETDSATPLRAWHQYDTDEERLSTEQALREWGACEDGPGPDDPETDSTAGGLYLTWIPDALRAGGCRVREEPGARTRGHGGMIAVRGLLVHHTGSAGMPGSRNVVRDGRSDLPGPLAQLTLDPDGTFSFIAAGQCWHPGRGGPLLDCPRDSGSPYLIGIEGVSNGTHWTDAARREYPKGVAAILRRLGAKTAEGWVAGHKEWAPTRKVDPGNWSMNEFRAEVNRHLRGGPTQEDDFMASLSEAEKGELFAKIREIHQRETQPLDFRGHHGEPKDNQQGQELSVRKELTWLREQVNRIEALLTPKAPGS